MGNNSLRKGIGVIILSKYSNVIFTLLANAILARLLSADDYGIVSIVTVFVTFFQLVSDMGLGTGVIQRQEFDDEDISNVFSFTIYLSLGFALCMCALAKPISIIYQNDVYIPICLMLSVAVFFYSINMIPNAILMKQKRFTRVGLRTIVVSIASYALAIIFALWGFKYYALVIQAIANAFITFVWNYSSTRIRIQLKCKLEPLKKIIGYSSCDLGFNIVSYFSRNADNLLVGKVMGTDKLGYYGKAYTLMLYPVSYLTGVISPVLHPVFAEHQNDVLYVYNRYVKVLKVLSLMGTYISIICFFASEEIVMILYGSNWREVIPCINALSISIWFQMTSSSCGGIYKSLGCTDLMLKSALVYVPIQLLFIVCGILSGDIVILAWLVSISFIIKFFVEYRILIVKGFKTSLLGFLRLFIPEIFISLVLCTVQIVAEFFCPTNIVFSLLFKCLIGMLFFILLLMVTGQRKCFSFLFKS